MSGCTLRILAPCLYALTFFVPGLRAQDGDDVPPPLPPIIVEKGENEPETEGNIAESFTRADFKFVDKLLTREIARDITSPDAANLRRLKRLIQNNLNEKRKRPKEETNLYERLKLDLQEEVRTADRKIKRRESLRRMAMFQLFREEWPEAYSRLRELGPESNKDISHPMLMAYVNLQLGNFARAMEYVKRSDKLLRPLVELELSRPVFCESVEAYRIYTPKGSTPVLPGDNLCIYTEIKGAAFVSNAAGKVDCNFSFGLIVKDNNQNIVINRPDYGEYKPSFRGMVQDMHASVIFRVPPNLFPGQYHLFLTCRDNTTGKEAKSSCSFTLSGNAKQGTNALSTGGNSTLPGITGSASDKDNERNSVDVLKDYKERMRDNRRLLYNEEKE